MLAQGPEVKAFEEEFSAHFGLGRACVAVNSGTSGLHLGLLAAGVRPGDEVIVPSFTFAATGNSVALTGATPVFADIEPDDFCLDPAAVEAAITDKTVGIMPVHLYGHPANMDRLTAIADKHGLQIYEDAAQAARRVAERHAGRRLRHLRDVLALPDQEHDLRRGRHGLGRRRRGRAADAAATQPGHGEAVPQRARRL